MIEYPLVWDADEHIESWENETFIAFLTYEHLQTIASKIIFLTNRFGLVTVTAMAALPSEPGSVINSWYTFSDWSDLTNIITEHTFLHKFGKNIENNPELVECLLGLKQNPNYRDQTEW